MIKFYHKYKQVILYLAFGILTTLVNIFTYFSLIKFWGIQYIISNVIAWLASVLFAYVTNRLFVFMSKTKGSKTILRECTAFIACRIFSGLFDTTNMYVMIDLLHFNDLLAKIITNIFVVILNYVLSKRVVFKDSREEVNYG